MPRLQFALGAEFYRLPAPPPPLPPPADAFSYWSVCPTPDGMGALAGLQAVYQAAFAMAQAVVQPSILERDLFACPN